MKVGELEIDWSYLRSTLIGWSLLVLLALLGSAGIYFYAQHNQNKQAELEQHLREIRASYFAALDAQKTVIEFQDRFLALQTGGKIGVERRLEWIEQLQKQARLMDLPELTYSLEARAPFSLPGVVELTAPLALSRMSLEMALWHEGDLFTLFSGLRQADIGLFWVRSCELGREPLVADGSTGQALVNANCELLWLTVSPESL